MSQEDNSKAPPVRDAELIELKAFADRLQAIERELAALRRELEVHVRGGDPPFVN